MSFNRKNYALKVTQEGPNGPIRVFSDDSCLIRLNDELFIVAPFRSRIYEFRKYVKFNAEQMRQLFMFGGISKHELGILYNTDKKCINSILEESSNA